MLHLVSGFQRISTSPLPLNLYLSSTVSALAIMSITAQVLPDNHHLLDAENTTKDRKDEKE
jgi:hypothetical protein